MILRFRSKSGMARIQTEPTSPISEAVESARAHFGLAGDFYVSDSPSNKGILASELNDTVGNMGLSNGALLYITEVSVPGDAQTTGNLEAGGYAHVTSTNSTGANATSTKKAANNAKNANTTAEPAVNAPPFAATGTDAQSFPVDAELDRAEGLIPRSRSALCRHGDRGMCEYCSPLPPWDLAYLAEHGIKHQSFWAHVKERQHLTPNSVAPLDVPDYRVRPCNSGHAPYPAGICSQCQPAPITLQQQSFRMVDHVEFADHAVMDRFLDAWRRSGAQRYGVMYGRYEPFDQVPLGIKAVVEAIYEPPQADEADGITLLEWENQAQVDQVAQSLGLVPVGAVFTDLTDSGARDGSVLCKRHKDSFFLSGVEVAMAARNQILHAAACRHSSTGRFSSKFVTCVITGNTKGEIEPRAYQVSASAEALIAADLICPSTQPSQVWINPTEGKRYVPDVFYTRINEYGLQVKTNAKPSFPIDYLLVTLSDGFPVQPTPMFTQRFPVENRAFVGEAPDLRSVRSQVEGGTDSLADFHLLVHIRGMDILADSEFALLMEYVRNRKEEDYVRLAETGGWMTLLTILEQST
ncbi:hypothetical protein CLUG_02015 [Clavispora lusitaniae ATCC 42720]|uniref:Nuclear protein localization protein 4 n=1 Tax=Clavispora lusitaniae (strain ATCC 42720) TaxID=306902 RepID=C4Y1D3_CLAL4|nr:uncharacterized protein CLUG_02015 [Clavispora lusitaniae ATCC 42720]EEQ37892.1 hypothetical protein CLUG_02015 [Clavispora lusitaniae ATCC 42720]